MFRRAVAWGLLERSPFAGIVPGSQINKARQRYMPLADLDRLLDACPSDEWRIVLAAARLAALRVPSKLGELQWGDVDFGAAKVSVTSPKLEAHGESAVRIVPLVPRLRAILLDAFSAAEPGSVYVVPRLRDPGVNLRDPHAPHLREGGP